MEKERQANPRLKFLSFNSSNKFMITAHQVETLDTSIPEKDRIVLVTLKGAPDIAIQRCSSYKMNNDGIAPLNAEMKTVLFSRQEEFGKRLKSIRIHLTRMDF